MKKTWWIGLTAICLTVALGGTAVIAEIAQEKKAGGERTRVTACDYVDADEDGVCDNAAEGRGQRTYVDADEDGVCDNATKGRGQRAYVDADEDGVCDNAAKGRGQRYGNTDGRGSGNGNGARRQCGVNRK